MTSYPTTTKITSSSPGRSGVRPAVDYTRMSSWFGIVFPVVQLVVMIIMTVLVLPLSGSPTDPVVDRGQRMLEAASTYRIANYAFMLSGVIILGFLAAVQARLRRADTSGSLATVAVGAGALLALIWPFAGVLHDLSLDVALAGTDVRFLAGWDAVAPYSLAFSALPRVFFVGAIVLGLRAAGEARMLRLVGVGVIVISLAGSATLVAGSLFPVLALSTLAFELWLAAVAWHWLRRP